MDTNAAGLGNLAELTADIVSAYVSNNTVRAEELTSIISTVYATLSGAGRSQEAAPAKAEAPMSWKKAIKPDGIVSFEDGKSYKSMKRHLTSRGMTPAQYREKWGLPRDFPMVSPNYSAARSEMAKNLGLGQNRKGKPSANKGRSKKAGVRSAA
jgi:predicted transcriptional regulator